MKVDELIKCPFCNEENWYVFYLGATSLDCHSCEKEFDIQTETKTTIKATKPRKICMACDKVFDTNGELNTSEECPYCGLNYNHSKY